MEMNKNVFVVAGLAAFMSDTAIAAPTVEQGIVVTFQNASDTNAKSEILASYDLVIDNSVGKDGHVIVYVEGSSNTQADGVVNTVGEANGDAGSATNTSGDGQFQVSELFYQHDIGSSFVTIGLMDSGAYFDGGEIANDEGASFITTDFVNNPTIEGQVAYSVGLGAHVEMGSISANLFIGDKVGYDGSYTNALHFQKDSAGNDKGLFTVVEATWAGDSTTLKAGYWMNSAKRQNHAKTESDLTNSGVFVLGEQKLGDLIVQGRFGQADKKVSTIATFFSLAGEYGVGPGALGAAYGMAKASQEYKDTNSAIIDDRTSVEVFYRYEGGENWTITPAFTSIKNSGLNSSTANDRKASVTVMTLRGTYIF